MMMTNLSNERGDPFGGPQGAEEGLARPSWKVVYAIIERGGGRKYWQRVGVAFVNRDGSLNVKLDAIPIGGQLHIRDAPPREPGRDGDERPGEREYGGNC